MSTYIVSKEDLKTHLFGATTGTKYDTILAAIALQVDIMFENMLGIKHSTSGGETITDEVLNSDGTNVIKTKFKPITEITTVKYRDASWAFSTYTELTVGNMDFDGNKIYTRDYVVAPVGIRNLKITYKVGYSDTNLPLDLKLAAILIGVGIFNQRNMVGFSGQSVQGININLDKDQFSFVKKILDTYRNIDVV